MPNLLFQLHFVKIFAVASMSMEKGFKHWHTDIAVSDNPLEAGLGFTCKRNIEFVGKSSVDEQRSQPLKKRQAFLGLPSTT